MSEKIKCELCEKFISIKGMHTHIKRSHGTDDEKSKYFSGNHKKYDDINYKQKIQEKAVAFWKNKKLPNVNCKTCNVLFKIQKQKQLESGNYFCSRSCSSKRPKSQHTKNKIKASIHLIYPKNDKNCPICDSLLKRKNTTYCSTKCKGIGTTLKNDWTSSLKEYRIRAKFIFALNKYPDEFDFDLIKKYGWYKASNRGNNLDGVSKDHMYSIKDGFLNKVDPLILSHPANCRLIQQKINASKHASSVLTLQELIDRINKWNEKYPV